MLLSSLNLILLHKYVNRHSEQQHIQLISTMFSYDGDYDGGDNYSNNYNDYNDHGNVAEIQS
jgi:hypothetical protein